MDRLTLGRLLSTFAALKPRLVALAQARTGSRAIAEELVQDTWLKLSGSRAETIDNPGGFINQVARNTISDHLRKERRRTEIDAEISDLLWPAVDDVSPERTLIGREHVQHVRAVLDELPEKTRRIFLMNRIESISHRRIAELFDMTDEAVYYHIRRALERLAELRDEIAD